MTTDILPQYSAYQDKIDQLKRELTGASVLQGKAPKKPGIAYATLGDAYADSVLGQAFADGVVNRAGANAINSSDPYSIPWTEEEENRKRLYDAQIQRDNLLESMGDNPTMEDIVALGEYDATIKQLTEELGLGSQEYTPGGKVDGYGLDDRDKEEDPQTAEGYYYIESIRQYYFDKANSNISDEEFNKKYPAGILDEWTVGLGKIVGWEACQKYIDSVSQVEKANGESTDEPYTIYSNPEDISNDTGVGLNEKELGYSFNDAIDTVSETNQYVEPIINSVDDLKTIGFVDNVPKAIKYGGKALTIFGAAIDTYEVGSTIYEDVIDDDDTIEKETVQTVVGTGASWGGGALGAWAGAKAGAATGALIGSIIPGAGTAIGAGIGGVIGGIIGAIAGSTGGDKLGRYVSGEVYDSISGEESLREVSGGGGTGSW
jgi:hypothetical protein